MVCPRCSLKNPSNALVCTRCGEQTPRPLPVRLETSPSREGPRSSPLLARELPSDRKGRPRGRAYVPPLRVRSAPAPLHLDRGSRRPPMPAPTGPSLSGPGSTSLPAAAPPFPLEPSFERAPVFPEDRAAPHLSRPERTTPFPAIQVARETSPAPAASSFLHALPTEPAPPAARTGHESALPEALASDPGVAALASEPPQAGPPLLRRTAALAVDLGVVALLTTVAAVLGVFAYGADALAPHLGRGFDYVLDGVLLGRAVGPLLLALFGLLLWAYDTLAHALLGATLGKELLGLAVVNRDGELPSLFESAWRSAASLLLLVFGAVGVAFTVVDPAGRGLHDRLVGTRVVRR